MASTRPRDRGEDGVAGRVLGVDDPPLAVPSLPREDRAGPDASRSKRHAQLVDQQLASRSAGPSRDELLDRGRVGHAVARLEDVAGQRGRVRRGVVDDPSLGQVAVGGERVGQREELDRQGPALAACSA